MSEGHQHLSASGVPEIVNFLVTEKKKMEKELERHQKKVDTLQQAVEQADFELRRRQSPSVKRQELENTLVSIEEAISKKRLDYESVAERLAINSGNRYRNISMIEETYKDNINSMQTKFDEEKAKLKQQINVTSSQYERELNKLKSLLKSQSTSTEALNVTQEGHIKRLESEKETISKSLTSLRRTYESMQNERNSVESNFENIKLELGQQTNRNQLLLDSEKTRVSSISKQQTELMIQLKTAEDGCRRRDEMIKQLKGEISTLQSDIEILQDAKKKLSTHVELFALTEEKDKQKYNLQTSTYEIEIENLKHQVAHKEEVLMKAQDQNVSLQETLRHTREEVKGLKDKVELNNTSSSRKSGELESDICKLKNLLSIRDNEIQTITDKYEDVIRTMDVELEIVNKKLSENERVKKQIGTETRNLSVSLETLQKERDEVDVYNNDLLSKLSQMECDTKQLTDYLTEHKGRSGRRSMELECKISELKEELSHSYSENQLLKGDIDNKREEVTSISDINDKRKSELELALSRLKQNLKDFESIQIKCSQSEAQLVTLTTKLESSNQESRSLSSEMAKLSQKLAEKLEEIQSIKDQTMHERRLAENKIHQLETNIVGIQTENKRTIEFLEISNSSLTAKVGDLNSEVESLRRDTGGQSDQLIGLNENREILKSKLNKTANSLENEKKDKLKLTELKSQLEQDLSDVRYELNGVLSQLNTSKQSDENLAHTLSQRERELAQMGTVLNERNQELDHYKMSQMVLTREKEKSDETVLKLEKELSEINTTCKQLEFDKYDASEIKEKFSDVLNQSEEDRRLLSDANLDNMVLKKECTLLREALDHFKGIDIQQLTHISTIQQSIADAKSALKSERAKTVREHVKCKKWRDEYKSMQSNCDTMHEDIVNLLGKLSTAESELETSNQRMEERKKNSISKLEGSLEKISEEKGRCEKSVSSLEYKISQLQTTLEKERQWKETSNELHQTILDDRSRLQANNSEIESELNENKLALKLRDLNIKKLQKENIILESKYKEVLEYGSKLWRPQ